jgi:hypothetical protein
MAQRTRTHETDRQGVLCERAAKVVAPFDLASGEVLAVAVIPAPVSGFAPVHRFVESFPHAMPMKPA